MKGLSSSAAAREANEPTRSENIAVTWRRSADFRRSQRCRWSRCDGNGRCAFLDAFEVGNRAQHFAPIHNRPPRGPTLSNAYFRKSLEEVSSSTSDLKEAKVLLKELSS